MSNKNEGKNQPEETGEIEELRDTLYSRTKYQAPEDKRTPVSSDESEETSVEEEWDTPDLDEMLKYERRKPEGHPFMKKLFVFAAAFFFIAVAAAAYMFLGGASFVSTRNVDIAVLGPVSASAGQVLEIGIAVTNRNNADLEMTDLSIQFPHGSRDPQDPARPLTYTREELGVVRAGREVTHNTSIILMGEQGQIQEIRVSVEYRVRGSNAIFRRDKTFEVVIGESPVSMTVSQPRFTNSGDVFTTTVTLNHTSDEILRNVMIRAEYPYGYAVRSSSPSAIGDGNLWALGDMAPGSTKVLTIEGGLVGEDNEERTFRFYVGVADPVARDLKFGANLVSTLETIAIARPSVALTMDLNGDREAVYIAPAGQSVSANVRFQNNLSDKLLNPRLVVTITGAALDKRTVSAHQGGFYDSQTNTITWNLESLDGLPELLPGVNGAASFTFSSLEGEAYAGDIKMEAVLTGTLVDATSRLISTSLDRSVRISSEVTLVSRALHSTGPFSNQGTLPPKVEEETTYTVVFTAGNTQNDIGNARVTAVLGPNVSWVSGSNGEISYNPSNNTITWNLGTLASGAGFSSPVREASFQVSLIPSLSQVGIAPTLVSGITLTGTDTFTERKVTVTNTPVSTRLSADPSFVQGDDLVVR